jgi:hypothetical protein
VTTWVVLLEWALGGNAPAGIDAATLDALLDGLSDLEPVALCQPDRFAIQLRLPEGEPELALATALARHRQALNALPMGVELVRIELLTPEELVEEWNGFAGSEAGRSAMEALGRPAGDRGRRGRCRARCHHR